MVTTYNLCKKPFVSVVVASYNSEETIIETLDSIKNQTYDNIELIITDDSSKDRTVELCEQWLGKNKEIFVSSKIVLSEKNTGVAPNFNRGIKESRGSWIKIIAGDDMLLPNCIKDFVCFLAENPDTDIVFSKVIGFGNMEAATKWPWKDCGIYFNNLTNREFFIRLCIRNFLPAASVIISRKCFYQLGEFDEQIPLLEDWPFWIKAFMENKNIRFLDEYTVKYRFGLNSISQGVMSEAFLLDNKKLRIYADQCLGSLGKCAKYYIWSLRMREKYKKSIWYYIVFYMNVFNPFFYEVTAVNKKFNKLYSLNKTMSTKK